MIRASDQVEDDHPALKHPKEREHWPWQIFAEPALHVFAVAVVLFQLANAALLPLALNALDAPQRGTRAFWSPRPSSCRRSSPPSLAPWAGRLAQRIGRRPVLIAGFAAVPVRALLFATLPGALPLGRVPGAGRRQRGGVRPDAAADRRRPDQANRLSEPRDRLRSGWRPAWAPPSAPSSPAGSPTALARTTDVPVLGRRRRRRDCVALDRDAGNPPGQRRHAGPQNAMPRKQPCRPDPPLRVRARRGLMRAEFRARGGNHGPGRSQTSFRADRRFSVPARVHSGGARQAVRPHLGLSGRRRGNRDHAAAQPPGHRFAGAAPARLRRCVEDRPQHHAVRPQAADAGHPGPGRLAGIVSIPAAPRQRAGPPRRSASRSWSVR